MAQRRRVVSPKIVQRRGAGSGLAVSALVLLLIAVAFAGGLLLGRAEADAAAEHARSLEERLVSEQDRLAALKQQITVLERAQQIDREANREAQQALGRAQDERLALEKEISFLKHVIREGGGGILEVQDFALAPGKEEREFRYSFTVTQLIQDFGFSEGKVEVKLAVKGNGEGRVLALSELEGSESGVHKMRFQHFQNIEGMIRLPEDLSAESLVVEIEPSTKKLVPVTETFAWAPRE